MKVKLTIYNDEFSFSKVEEIDDEDYSYIHSAIREIPKNHIAYGLWECLCQGDHAPMWDPDYIKLEKVEKK